MKSRNLFFLSLFAQTVFAGPTPLAPDASKVENAVNLPSAASSRWSIGAGVFTRQIKGDFSLSSPGSLNLSVPRGSSSGRGDVGFFTGGNGMVRYNDGTVGPQFIPADGTASTTINSASQISNSRSSSGTPFEIVDLSFHSSLNKTSYSNQYSPETYQSTDEQTGVGPYLELRYAVFQNPRADVNLVFGYSWINAELASGAGLLAT